MAFNLKKAFQQGKDLATQTLASAIITVDQAAADTLDAAAKLRAKGIVAKDNVKAKTNETITLIGTRLADRADEISATSADFASKARKALNIAPKEEPKAAEPVAAAATPAAKAPKKAAAKKAAPKAKAPKAPKA
ncbi:MAG: hypothetical protein PW788_04050 [Micavibrio sp.]|nr:hypothetical protein [Micavibrio sp.]